MLTTLSRYSILEIYKVVLSSESNRPAPSVRGFTPAVDPAEAHEEHEDIEEQHSNPHTRLPPRTLPDALEAGRYTACAVQSSPDLHREQNGQRHERRPFAFHQLATIESFVAASRSLASQFQGAEAEDLTITPLPQRAVVHSKVTPPKMVQSTPSTAIQASTNQANDLHVKFSICIGARIMIVKNLWIEGSIVNALGTVEDTVGRGNAQPAEDARPCCSKTTTSPRHPRSRSIPLLFWRPCPSKIALSRRFRQCKPSLRCLLQKPMDMLLSQRGWSSGPHALGQQQGRDEEGVSPTPPESTPIARNRASLSDIERNANMDDLNSIMNVLNRLIGHAEGDTSLRIRFEQDAFEALQVDAAAALRDLERIIGRPAPVAVWYDMQAEEQDHLEFQPVYTTIFASKL